MEDKNIIELFFERSEKAITELLNKYGRLSRSLAQGILLSEEDCDECMNTACMRMWNAIPPKKPENLGGYFCRIVRNIAISEYHRDKKRAENETETELYEIIPDTRTVELEYEAGRISGLLNEFLEKQNKKNRRIFVSRYYLNLSLSAISSSMGMGEGAIKSRLYRMRAELKDFLQERGVEI